MAWPFGVSVNSRMVAAQKLFKLSTMWHLAVKTVGLLLTLSRMISTQLRNSHPIPLSGPSALPLSHHSDWQRWPVAFCRTSQTRISSALCHSYTR